MSDILRFTLGIAILIYFFLIIRFIKKNSLSLKYSLLWLFSGVIMTILVIFPRLLDWLVSIVDIKTPVNGLFAFSIFLILVILMSITVIVSRQTEKIKCLVQYNAILEKRIRELENKKV